MVKKPTNFADIDQARSIVERLYPDAGRIETVEHGYDNIVVLVDDQYAVRFPRSRGAYVRSLYEKSILTQLGSIHSVEVPHLLGSNEDPPYAVTSYVEGRHLSAADVREFSRKDQIAFGETVATFAYELHSSIAASEEEKAREQADFGEQFDESWATFFERVIMNGTFSNKDQEDVAHDYYEKWLAFERAPHQKVVIHDDLYMNNMLFERTQLVGVLDFGDASVGTAEQELRQLFRINETVLLAAVTKYEQLARKRLDVEAIKVWAIIRELGAYSRRLRAGKVDHPGFRRSCEHLNEWLPSLKWG